MRRHNRDRSFPVLDALLHPCDRIVVRSSANVTGPDNKAVRWSLSPVIGVVTSAIALGEPLGPGQIAALVFTLAGVVLATRA